jgi:hypothetical protein
VFNLRKRVRIRSTANSELGQLHAGQYGEIIHFTAPEGWVRYYTVRLDDGKTQLELKPEELEIFE